MFTQHLKHLPFVTITQVKARDKEFKSVPDLVHYFSSSKLPLVIAGIDVFLNQPVLTAFP